MLEGRMWIERKDSVVGNNICNSNYVVLFENRIRREQLYD